MTTERIDIVVREDGSRVVRRNMNDISASATRANSTIDTLKKTLSSFGGVLLAAGIGLGISQIIKYTDAWTDLNSKIKLVTNTTNQFLRTQNDLYDLSQRTRTSLIETVALYSTIKKSTEALNTTDAQRLRVTETINKAIVVSGTSAASSKAALIQLGQALGSGVLRGEELNSVMEQAPRLAQAIAEGLGKTTSQLRAMGMAGLLTSEQVYKALENQSSKLDAEFAKMATTVSQSFIVAENALTRFFGTTNEANGSARALAQSIIFLSQHLNEISAILLGIIAMKAAQFFVDMTIAIYRKVVAVNASIVALQAERAATLASAQAEAANTAATVAGVAATQAAIVAAREEMIARLAVTNNTIASTTALIANAEAQIVSARTAIAAATAAGAQSFAMRTLLLATRELNVAEATRIGLVADLAIAEQARAVALAELAILGQQQVRVSAAATAATVAQTAASAGLATATTAAAGGLGLASRALGFLGGPIGIITTLLGLGVTAWALWGNKAVEQETVAAETLESKTADIIANLDKQILKLKERNALAAVDPDLAKGKTPEAQQQADIRTRINAVGSGKDINGVANEYANLDISARTEILKTLGKQYNDLSTRIKEAGDQQEIFTKNMRGDKLKEFMKEFATVAEQRKTEIEKWKLALGDLFTPELEKRIVDSFNDTSAKLDYKSALQALENKQAQEKEIMQQGLAHADSLRKQGLLSESKFNEQQLTMQLTELDNLKTYTQKQLDLATGDDQKAARQKYLGELQLLELKRVGIVQAANDEIDAIKSGELEKEQQRTNTLTNSIYQQTQGIQDQIDAYNKLPEALTGTAIAELEVNKIMLQGIEGSEEAVAKIQQRIDALNSLRSKQQELSQLQLIDFDTKSIGEQWQALGQIIGDSLSDGFGKAGKAVGGLSEAFANMKKSQNDIALNSAERMKKLAGNEVLQEKEKRKASRETELARVNGYANMLGAAKDFFSENTAAYKVLGAAEKAYRVYELALALENFAIKTGLLTTWLGIDTSVKATATTTDATFTAASVTKSGLRAAADGIAAVAKTLASLPFPFNVAAGVAVIAMLGAIGVKIGGGGGGGGGASAAEVQKTQGTGTVFGDDAAKSESLSKSLDILKDNSDITLPISQAMLKSLQSIENSIKGVANLVLRATGVTSGENIVELNNSAPGQATDFVSKFMTELSKGLLGPVVGGKLAEFGNKLWGSVKQNVVDAGIQFGGSVSQLQAGQGFNQYASVDTTKKSWFGLSKKTTNEVVTAGLEDELTQQLALIFKNLEETLKLAAPTLGKDAAAVSAAVRAVVIDQTKISLKDLKGEELTAELNAAISKAMDQISQAAFPSLDGFRQVGEGYSETVIRVANGIEVAKAGLERFNVTAIQYTDIINKQGDVATEIIRQSLEGSGKLSAGVKDIVSLFSGAGDELLELYGSLVSLQRQLNNTGLNGNNLSSATIAGAGGVSELKSGLTDYFENFFTDAEQKAAALKDLTQQFKDMGQVIPTTKDGFKELITRLDDGTVSGSKLVGQLLSLSGAFAEVMEQSKEQQAILDQQTDLQDQYNRLTMSSVQLRRLERDAIAEVNKPLFDQITALSNVQTLLGTVQDSVTKDKAVLQAALDAKNKTTDALISSATLVMDKAKSLQSSLDSALASSISGTGDSSANRQFAQSQIASALAIAKASGVLPNADDIKGALGTLTQGSNQQQFGSSLEYRLDYYKTRDNLTQLSTLNGKAIDKQQVLIDTLTAQKEQDQIAYDKAILTLDRQLELAQRSVDALTGIRENTLTTSQAIAALNTAIAGLANSGKTPGSVIVKDPNLNADSNTNLVEGLYQNILGRQSEAAGLKHWVDALDKGMTIQDVIAGFYGSDEYKAAHAPTIPGFDTGGDHTGGLRTVGETGVELEATGPSRIWSHDQVAGMLNGGGNDALEAKIDLLLEAMQQTARATGRTATATEGTQETLDVSSKGGRPLGVIVKERA